MEPTVSYHSTVQHNIYNNATHIKQCIHGVYNIPVVIWRPFLPPLRPILVRVAEPAAHDVVVAGHHGEALGDGVAVVVVGLRALPDGAWKGREGTYM